MRRRPRAKGAKVHGYTGGRTQEREVAWIRDMGWGHGHGHAHAATDALRRSRQASAESPTGPDDKTGRAPPAGAVQPPWPNDKPREPREPRAGLVPNHGKGTSSRGCPIGLGSLSFNCNALPWPPFARARLPLRREAGGFRRSKVHVVSQSPISLRAGWRRQKRSDPR